MGLFSLNKHQHCILQADKIAISNPVFKIIGQTKILIPGLSDVITKKGDYITILVIVELVVLAVAIYIAQ